jgi:hypothetical protein
MSLEFVEALRSFCEWPESQPGEPSAGGTQQPER